MSYLLLSSAEKSLRMCFKMTCVRTISFITIKITKKSPAKLLYRRSKTNLFDNGTNASPLTLIDGTHFFVPKKVLITSFGLNLVPAFAVLILTCRVF